MSLKLLSECILGVGNDFFFSAEPVPKNQIAREKWGKIPSGGEMQSDRHQVERIFQTASVSVWYVKQIK